VGSPLRLALVGCGKTKRDRPTQARRLYTGGLFRSAYGYAAAPGRFSRVYILSARYGLVEPRARLAPYDLTLAQLGAGELWDWAAAVRDALLERFGRERPLELTLLAGRLYCEPLMAAAQAYALPWAWHQPLFGLTQGYRLKWFKQFREAEAANDAPAKERRRV
jgi:hypothetical protein